MGKINGVVKDYKGKVLKDAEVLFVDRSFNVISSGYSNEEGEYYLQVNEKTNGMVVGTHSYGEDYLAFSFCNVSSHMPYHIDIIIGNVEFLQYKREMTKDSDNYTSTFQIASLYKILEGEKHISPRIDETSFSVMLDEKSLENFTLEKEEIFIEEKGISVDSYRLSFISDIHDRGKVLTLLYKEDNSYGILKCFV
jgi:hypothetical protein